MQLFSSFREAQVASRSFEGPKAVERRKAALHGILYRKVFLTDDLTISRLLILKIATRLANTKGFSDHAGALVDQENLAGMADMLASDERTKDMLQRDYSEFAVSSSHALHRVSAGETPLWLQGWRTLQSSARIVSWPLLVAARTLHRWRREAATIRELSGLRDRELRDIGIERSAIPAIARSMTDDLSAPPRAAYAAPILKVVPRQGPAQPCCS